MITQWEIVSKIDPKDSSVLYALVMDGTEHDARLIAKKLQAYVKSPKPAEAPYVYCFPLSPDLDEDTLEKIRQAMRDGISRAKEVNEFRPGGSFGQQLFEPNTEHEDKTFPTLLTSDPSQSEFGKPLAEEQSEATSRVKKVERKSIDLDATPNDPSPVLETARVQLQASDLEPQTIPTTNPVPQTPEQSAISDKSSVQPETQRPAAPVPTAPVTTNSAQSLDDIFLAETKYDMFVDVNQTNKDKPTKPSSAITNDIPPGLAKLEDTSSEHFNVFDQKIKDQTCVMDVDDVTNLTGSLAKKDLGFVQHAQVPEAEPPADKTPTPPIAPHTLSSSRLVDADNKAAEVMDPFEQLLAGSTPKKDTPAPDAPASSQEKPATKQTEAPKTSNDRVKNIMENKNMTENTGDQNTPLQKPQPPQAPVAPAAPQQPKAPQPEAPAPATQASVSPEPQEEVHHTILRRRRPAAAPLDKTTTIDHSIELPLSELQKHNWPLEVPLIPTHTLENMTISINRFAHATAISVIDNPGKLYNPLVLHGSTGTGKTHFLHAIGYALSKKFGQENVFITNGVRLSRGIQRYIMEGNIKKFEEFTASVKALLIDDIHLISINEQNRTHLSKLLNDFRSQHKQIVITSKYPPENLAKLEELLNFKLDSGWISDLKQAKGSARLKIIQQMLSSNNINITNDDINNFFGQPNMSLGTVVRSIRRVRVLEKLMFPNTPPEEQSSLAIFNQLLAVGGDSSGSAIATTAHSDITSVPISGDGEWGRIGFFYPQNHSDMMNWLVWAIQQRAKELGIPGGPEIAVRSSYSTENIISSAFKIANLCDNKKLKGAVILGPSAKECDPSVRENFYDILTHMLEIMLIRCGVINFEEVDAPNTYVKILAELLR